MKRFGMITLYLGLAVALVAVQFRVMTYNSLNFNGEDAARAAYFGQVVQSAHPHVLIMQEMINQDGVDMMLDAICEVPGDYAAATFVNGYDTDNILFYKPFAVTLLDQDYIETDLREIGEYELDIYGVPFNLYSCHLKASQGYEQQRLAEVTVLRNHLNALPEGAEFAVGGDMNMYGASEPGYQKFIADEADNDGRSFDPSLAGEWHDNTNFVTVHTQSTRDVSVGGGASGGLDDRFDFLFVCYDINDGTGIEYVDESYTPYGNDGNHFNDAINDGENTAVGAEIADALYGASDHLPVFADFETANDCELALDAFRIEDASRAVLLSWVTRAESDMLGFNILINHEDELNTAVELNENMIAAQNSPGENLYGFEAQTLFGGYNYFWLEMIGDNGATVCTNPLQYYATSVDDDTTPSIVVSLEQNWPNPFNPSTTIAFNLSAPAAVELSIYNLRGQRVATLVNDQMPAGRHLTRWHGQDDYGQSVASGVYFCRLAVGSDVRFCKMVLMK